MKGKHRLLAQATNIAYNDKAGGEMNKTMFMKGEHKISLSNYTH